MPEVMAVTDAAVRTGARVSARVAEIRGVGRRFKDLTALEEVSMTLRAGEVHALLGPNGAGKTTLLRLLTGLVTPTSGTLSVLGRDPARAGRGFRSHLGMVPSGDRSLYLRLSGHDNLVFFARMHGVRRREAATRAREVLADVGLTEAADRPAGHYSHGMQKRLSLARALLTEPSLLLVDEVSHDLDPQAAGHARRLARQVAERGAAVLWTTQRVEEIRGFADEVTVLAGGRVRFQGAVTALMEHASPRRYLLRVRNGHPPGPQVAGAVAHALAGLGTATPENGLITEHYLVALAEDVPLGDAIAALAGADLTVHSCREAVPEIEDAFLSLTGGGTR